MNTEQTEVLAWHWVRQDGTTEWLREPEQIGVLYRVEGEIKPCRNGLHGSIKALDALELAGGPVIRRVKHSGVIVHDEKKLASSERTVLAQADATILLHEFACWCAETALLREREAGREPDARCWKAVEAKRGWLAGQVSDEELDVARDAAWVVARDAAWDAAWVVAWVVARDAAWVVARDAARAAAWDAARAAAWDAAWDAENAELEKRLFALLAENGYTELAEVR